MSINYFTNHGKGLALSALAAAYTLKVMLVDSGYTPDKDHQYASSASAHEITASGYTGGYGGGGRKAITSAAVTVDTATDIAYLTGDSLAYTSIGATGTSPAYALIIIETGGGDSTSPIVGVADAAITLNGNNLTLTPSATGYLKLT